MEKKKLTYNQIHKMHDSIEKMYKSGKNPLPSLRKEYPDYDFTYFIGGNNSFVLPNPVTKRPVVGVEVFYSKDGEIIDCDITVDYFTESTE